MAAEAAGAEVAGGGRVLLASGDDIIQEAASLDFAPFGAGNGDLLKLFLALLLLLGIIVLWDFFNDLMEFLAIRRDQKHLVAIRDRIFKELTLFGFLAIFLFVLVRASGETGEIAGVLFFEIVHFSAFGVALMYCVLVVILACVAQQKMHFWHNLELGDLEERQAEALRDYELVRQRLHIPSLSLQSSDSHLTAEQHRELIRKHPLMLHTHGLAAQRAPLTSLPTVSVSANSAAATEDGDDTSSAGSSASESPSQEDDEDEGLEFSENSSASSTEASDESPHPFDEENQCEDPEAAKTSPNYPVFRETSEGKRRLWLSIRLTLLLMFQPWLWWRFRRAQAIFTFHELRIHFIVQHRLSQNFMFHSYLKKSLKSLYSELAEISWSAAFVLTIFHSALWMGVSVYLPDAVGWLPLVTEAVVHLVLCILLSRKSEHVMSKLRHGACEILRPAPLDTHEGKKKGTGRGRPLQSPKSKTPGAPNKSQGAGEAAKDREDMLNPELSRSKNPRSRAALHIPSVVVESGSETTPESYEIARRPRSALQQAHSDPSHHLPVRFRSPHPPLADSPAASLPEPSGSQAILAMPGASESVIVGSGWLPMPVMERHEEDPHHHPVDMPALTESEQQFHAQLAEISSMADKSREHFAQQREFDSSTDTDEALEKYTYESVGSQNSDDEDWARVFDATEAELLFLSALSGAEIDFDSGERNMPDGGGSVSYRHTPRIRLRAREDVVGDDVLSDGEDADVGHYIGEFERRLNELRHINMHSRRTIFTAGDITGLGLPYRIYKTIHRRRHHPAEYARSKKTMHSACCGIVEWPRSSGSKHHALFWFNSPSLFLYCVKSILFSISIFICIQVILLWAQPKWVAIWAQAMAMLFCLIGLLGLLPNVLENYSLAVNVGEFSKSHHVAEIIHENEQRKRVRAHKHAVRRNRRESGRGSDSDQDQPNSLPDATISRSTILPFPGALPA